MKFTFDGTLAEWTALFGGTPPEATKAVGLAEEGADDPSADEPPAAADPIDSVLSGLPKVKPEMRRKAWALFVDTCNQWVQGFEDETAEQPDRIKLLSEIGSGPWPIPILVMAYEARSLQRLVERALGECGFFDEWLQTTPQQTSGNSQWLDFVDRVAANMVQVSHTAFADLAGTYDYSSRWRRDDTQERA